DVVDQLLADAVDVRDLRLGADPDAVVDHAADVLGELAVERGPDRADLPAEADGGRCTGRASRGRPPDDAGAPARDQRRGGAFQHGPAVYTPAAHGHPLSGVADRSGPARVPGDRR